MLTQHFGIGMGHTGIPQPTSSIETEENCEMDEDSAEEEGNDISHELDTNSGNEDSGNDSSKDNSEFDDKDENYSYDNL